MADNNNNATGAAITAGIGSAIGGIFSNLWSAKERRRNQEWNEKMYRDQVMDNRINATTAWTRETDINYLMNQYKNAGINPYMVTGQSFNAPTAQGGSANATAQAKGDFSFIGQIPQIMAQTQLLNSQRQNLDADTNLKSTANDQNSFNLQQDKKYKDKVNDITLENIKQTNSNLSQTTALLKSQTEAQGINNMISSINSQFQFKLKQLDVETATLQNKKSQYEIKHIESQIANLNQATAQIKSIIDLNIQALTTGKITQAHLATQILEALERTGLTREKKVTESELREDNKRNIQRSNMSIFAPVQKGIQLWKQKDK